MSSKGYIKFWGVRGSFPTPDIEKLNYGGDTSCVEVRNTDNQLFIFDMGTGLRNLGEKIVSDTTYPKDINILLSHYHWDHIMGFFTFAPLYIEGYNINIYGYNKHTSINKLSDTLINTNFWPADQNMYKANIQFKEREDMIDFIINGSSIGKPYGVNGVGGGRMPGFGTALPESDIELIVDFLRGLSPDA